MTCISQLRSAEMFRYDRFPATRKYAVEVSGWDFAQEFFVEKCDLVWNEDTGKEVALKQNLRDKAVLFVRLLRVVEAGRSHPVVYEAKLAGTTVSGLRQIRLNMVVPG